MWMNLEVSIEEYVVFLFPYVVILLTASLKSFPLNMNIVNGSVTFTSFVPLWLSFLISTRTHFWHVVILPAFLKSARTLQKNRFIMMYE